MNYEGILSRIDEIEAWLRTSGLGVKNTRLSKYKNDLLILSDPKKRENLRSYFNEPELHALFFTFTELHELYSIFSALRVEHEPLLKRHFLQVIDGPANSSAERPANSSNRPRNLQFELYLTAHLSNAGFPILDGGLTDIKTSFSDRDILIECKRPQHQTGLHAAIKDGVGQLKKRPSLGAVSPIRILAVSLTKALTDGRAIFRSENANDAMAMVGDAINQSINPHVSYFHRQAGPSVAGILAHASAATIPLDTHSPATVTMQIFFDNSQASSDEQLAAQNWFREYEKIQKLP